MSTTRLTWCLWLMLFIIGLMSVVAAQESTEMNSDQRSYQHGINFIPRGNNQWLLIWASSGNPPQGEDSDGNWTHDIYYSLIDAKHPLIRPQTLISKAEAQEPASSAVNSDGMLMITMEDGWNTERNVAQRYGVYDLNLNPIKPYPQLVLDGGHSGHIAAAGARFVVFYSDEWVNGGGVDNLGSGDDVLANIYNSQGVLERKIKVAVGNDTRDWWPLVASSSSATMLVWQRFVENQTWSELMMAVLNPTSGEWVQQAIKIADQLKYYTYTVQYLPALKRFLVTGTDNSGEGFAQLYAENGQQLASLNKLPAVMREAQIMYRELQQQTLVAQAIAPAGMMVLSVTANSLSLRERIAGQQAWSISGSDGIFLDDKHLWMVGLSTQGLQQHSFEIQAVSAEKTAIQNPASVKPEAESNSWFDGLLKSVF